MRLRMTGFAQWWSAADSPPKQACGTHSIAMVTVGVEVEPERLADGWRQAGRQPDRQLGRAVASDEEVRAAGCLQHEHTRTPLLRREPQARYGAGPWQRSHERQRVDPQFGRPADQRMIGGRRFRRWRERTGPKGPSFPPATAGR